MICDKININITSSEYNNCSQSPFIRTYIQEKDDNIDVSESRPAVVICPGGGYSFISEREAEPVALKFASMGYQVFVLNYSIAPARYPAALFELASTVAMIRDNAKVWCVDPDKIVVCGFSAGGHLAACLSVFWNSGFISDALSVAPDKIRPNASILSYPVITSGKHAHKDSFICLLGENADKTSLEAVSLENKITSDTPPTFLWHTFEDSLVPCENSLLYAKTLKKFDIPFELHIFNRGGHGLSLANKLTNAVMPECQQWIDMADRWFNNLNMGM